MCANAACTLKTFILFATLIFVNCIQLIVLKITECCTIKVMVAAAVTARPRPAKEQVYILNAYSVFSCFALFLFGSLYLITGHNIALGWIEIASGVLILINSLVLWKSHSYKWACRIFLTLVMALLIVLLVTGGIGGTGIFWYFTFPMCAFFLTGRRRGLVWSLMLFIVTLVVIIAGMLIPFPLAYDPLSFQQLLVIMVVITAGTYVYQTSHEELQQKTADEEQNLETEMVKSDAVIDNIGEAVVVTDRGGHIVRMNTAAEMMLGWRFNEVAGKRFADKIPVQDTATKHIRFGDDAMRPLQLSLDKLEKVEMATTYVRKNGNSFSANVVVTPIVISKKLLGAVITIRDITEELAVDRAKSEFVTLASHQLRTPASAIGWTSELLLSGDVGKLSEEQAEYIEKIYTSNKRLLSLLDDLLTTSSLELGGYAMTPSKVDIALVVHHVLQTQLKEHKATKLHVEESYDAALPEIINDVVTIKSIAQRLISNAIKYTPADGSVAVSVRHSHEKLSPESSGSVLIQVTDTGYGIPEHQQQKVFTKLFRADNIKKQDTDGTGLGLYITKALVERMNGKVWFSSEQNKGSQFSVLLPIEGIKQ